MSKSMTMAFCLVFSFTLWIAGPSGTGVYLSTAAAQDETKAGEGEDNVYFWLQEIAQAGPQHAVLAPMAGEWNTKLTIWVDGPGQAPAELDGTATRTWILGDRYLEERGQNLMEDGKSTYEGVGYYGYNRATGLYKHVWMDNLSTGMYSETGRFDPVTNQIKTNGSFHDVATGFVTQNRTEINIEGPDRHTLTGYSTYEDGREFKQIEIVFTRKQ